MYWISRSRLGSSLRTISGRLGWKSRHRIRLGWNSFHRIRLGWNSRNQIRLGWSSRYWNPASDCRAISRLCCWWGSSDSIEKWRRNGSSSRGRFLSNCQGQWSGRGNLQWVKCGGKYSYWEQGTDIQELWSLW